MAFGLKGIISLDNSGFMKAIKQSRRATDDVKNSAKGAGSSIKDMLGAAAGIAGLTVGVGHAVKTFIDFEKQMSVVKGMTGATGNDLELLSNKAMEMGRILPASASDAAGAMTNLASAGFDTNQIMSAIEGTLYLATAAQVDMATAATITAGTLRGFGLEASKANHVADVLAMTANTTGAEIGDLGEAMKYVAPVAHASGLSLEEMSAAVGIMANANIKGSQAGTTLRGAISRLTNPTGRAAAAMQKMGFSAFDSMGNMKPLSKMIRQIKNNTKDWTQQERNAAITRIFGQEALSGMIALIDSGADKIDDVTNALKNSDGQAQKTAKVYSDNIGGALEEVEGAYETLEIQIVKKGSPAIQGALKDVADAIPIIGEKMVWVAEVIADNIDMIKGITAVYATYRGALLLTAGLEAALAATMTIRNGIMAISTVATMVYGSIQGGAAVGTTILTGAQLLLNAALAANPVGLVVLAIAALVAGVVVAYKKLDWFKNLVDGLWESLKSMGSAVGGAFSSVGKFLTGGDDKKVKKNANGTSYFSGGASAINERGGEMQVLPNGTSIIPADRTKEMISNNTTTSSNTDNRKIDIHIDARGMQVDELVDELELRLANI